MRPFSFALPVVYALLCGGMSACATPTAPPAAEAPSPMSPASPQPGSTPDQPATPQGEGPQSISFSAYPCFGFCPDFTVTVRADGGVRYEGRRFTALVGVHDLPNNPALFQALSEVIASPQLPWPRRDVQPGKGECDPVATDLPSYEVRVRSEQGARGFNFYAGCGGTQAQRARALTDALMESLAAHGVPTQGGVRPARGGEP